MEEVKDKPSQEVSTVAIEGSRMAEELEVLWPREQRSKEKVAHTELLSTSLQNVKM